MKAILNFYNDPRLSEMQEVVKGDLVKANRPATEFNLTEDKEYEVLDVNSVDLITIKNDKGEIDIYSVEYFYI
ncbi:hypothetical protein EJM73_08340 [Clostridium botulinum]|uniref:hypothetical protein n=1 Tax=Clostridium botulinum TaxID=1491 RepID=UPI00137616D4|nr:hypothetical protein [Clostridium botulinum]NCI19908.1 hypothetical protein [Clostridium botulinum]NCI35670.1 hypothetical protein [Clostridium botulinum]NCI71803.1 hypothetical protein [Clostridium botulinum]NDI38719.1 hypothetical protein [Clostridium botulinum]HCL4455058.1 hypothetical protein [Clostridium botulinum]